MMYTDINSEYLFICDVFDHIQSNLSKPYSYKTEHLPKPNDFRGPEFFPYNYL